MKFEDLQEGKYYRAGACYDGNAYLIKDGGLWMPKYNGYSNMTMEKIMQQNFEEVPQYVTFKRAIVHMTHIGHAKLIYFNGDETEPLELYKVATMFDGKKHQQELLRLRTAIDHVEIPFNTGMLNSKWILL